MFLFRLDEAFSWPPLFSFSTDLAVCFFFYLILKGGEEREEKIIVLFGGWELGGFAPDTPYKRGGNKRNTR